MSDTILNYIQNAHSVGKKLFAVLIDPEKCSGDSLLNFVSLVNKAKPDFIFVGGSQLRHSIDEAVIVIKEHSSIPVVLFIGNAVQFSPNADAMLVLSLISGRNPDFLIGQHVECAVEIKKSGIEAIPTGYVLVGRGQRTAVETVSGTDALSDTETIVRTAIAGEADISRSGEWSAKPCVGRYYSCRKRQCSHAAHRRRRYTLYRYDR